MALPNRSHLLLVGLLWSALILAAPPHANAGTILGAPSYMGLSSGLVGYWPFNGKDISGVTAYDRSGSGNNGTLTNGPTKTSGKLGQALNFDGVNDYVDVGSASSLDNLKKITVSAWMYARSFGGSNFGFIVDKEQNTGTAGWQIGMSPDNNLRFYAIDGIDNTGWYSPANSISLNAWQHVVVTFIEGSDPIFYINGVVQITSNTDPGTKLLGDDNANVMTIGHITTNTFDGLIDDVRVYNRALSPDEIKRLYKIGSTLKFGAPNNTGSLSNGLVGWWTFDGKDTAGTDPLFVYDRSGNGNNGSTTNITHVPIKKIGQALNFDGATDGTGDYIKMNHLSAFDGAAQMTAAAWVKWGGSSGGWTNEKQILDQSPCDGSTGQFELYGGYTGAEHKLDFALYTNTIYQNSGPSQTSIDDGAWHHVAGVYDGTRVKLYVDGNLENSQPTTTPITTTGRYFSVGGDCNTQGGATDHYWNGPIDDVRLYNRALTPDEIKRLYKIGSTYKTGVANNSGSLSNGLVGWWTFDGKNEVLNGSGILTSYDRSGNNNNGSSSIAVIPKKVIGKIGQALDFDGVNDYMDAGTGASVTNLKSLTISMWMYPRLGATYLISKGYMGGFGAWDSRIDNNNNVIKFTTGDGVDATDWDSPANSITYGTWQHVGITFVDGGTPDMYINGIKQTVTNTNPGTQHIGDDSIDCGLRIGAANADGSCGLNATSDFNGSLDDVRVYNRALTPDEIKRLYNMGR